MEELCDLLTQGSSYGEQLAKYENKFQQLWCEKLMEKHPDYCVLRIRPHYARNFCTNPPTIEGDCCVEHVIVEEICTPR